MDQKPWDTSSFSVNKNECFKLNIILIKLIIFKKAVVWSIILPIIHVKRGTYVKVIEIWKTLEIEQTKDENIIRDAYRRKLVHTNPEDDEEGFKKLRESYEAALIYARKREDGLQEKTPIDKWLAKVEEVYSHLSMRCDEEKWRILLADDLCADLDSSNECCMALLAFLMEHYYLPQNIWKMIEHTFCIRDLKPMLYEKFPKDFIDYVIRKLDEEDFVTFDSFKGEDDADYDSFIRQYFEVKRLLDQRQLEEARKQIEQIAAYHIEHPLLLVEKMRLSIYEDHKEEAKKWCEMLKDIDCDLPYARYFLGVAYWEAGEAEKAGEVWKKLLADKPEYHWAKFELIKYDMFKENYEEAKTYCIELLEQMGNQEILIKNLMTINEKLLNDMCAKWERLSNKEQLADEKMRYEMAWCYFQNKNFDKCEQLLMYEPTEEYEFEYNNLKGRNYLAASRYKEALPYLNKWLEQTKQLVPDGTEKTQKRIERKCYAYYTVGACYKSLEVYDKAITYLEEGCKVGGEDVLSCKEQLADLYLTIKQNEKCIDLCEEIIEKLPQFYPAYLLRQKAYFEMNNGQKVIDDFYNCYHIYPNYYEPYAIAMKTFISYGQYDDAVNIYEKAKESKLESDTLSFLYEQCLRFNAKSRQDLEGVVGSLENLLLQIDKENTDISDISEIESELAICYMRLGKCDEALDNIEKALMHKADTPRYLWIKADILSRSSQYREALELYSELEKVYPNNPNLYTDKGDNLESLSLHEEALKNYEKAIELQPKHPAAYGRMAEIYEDLYEALGRKADYQKALSLIERQLEINASCYYYVSEGLIYLAGYEFEKAIESFKKGMEDNPEDLYTFNNTGYAYKIMERYEEAVAMYKEAAKRMKNNESILPYYNLAVVYLIMEKYQKALDAIEVNINKFAYSTKCRQLLSEIYGRMQAYDSQLKCYRADYKAKRITEAEYCSKMGSTYRNKGNDVFAHYYYLKGINAENCSVQSYIDYGDYFLEGGKYRAALTYYKKGLSCLRISQSQQREIYENICRAYGGLGNQAKAQAYFDKALKMIEAEYGSLTDYYDFPGYRPARLYNLGLMYYAVQDYKKAKECFDKMTQGRKCKFCHYKTCYEALLGRALIYEVEGKMGEAAILYEEAYQIEPTDGMVRNKKRQTGKHLKGAKK